MIYDIKTEMISFADIGIDIEEKAFLDILAHMCQQYDFTYDDDEMLALAKEMKVIVDDSAQYPDWSNRDDIKAKLKVDLILLQNAVAVLQWPTMRSTRACWSRRNTSRSTNKADL